ncbi:MAG: ATP-binding cassette domain-containing protein [Ferruginibacter sp.]
MNINLHNTGKRFNREWIFRNFNYQFLQGKSYAVTGANGSGKSTLLQIIAGATLHSEGEINWQMQAGNAPLPTEIAYQQIAIAAPYLDLIEEMTANELLAFHKSFKPLTKSFIEILSFVGLQKASDKQIRYYSSGMKQRLKLAQAFFSETSVLLLDEPTTNLDEEGITVYKRLWKEHTANKLVIVSSNDTAEYENCEAVIKIGDYKHEKNIV